MLYHSFLICKTWYMQLLYMFTIFCLDLNVSGSPADSSGWGGPRLGHIENSILIFDLLSMGIIVGNARQLFS